MRAMSLGDRPERGEWTTDSNICSICGTMRVVTNPMRIPNERSAVHVSPRPALPCQVYVSSGAAPEGWYAAELLEWIRYPIAGWVGVARYSTKPSGGYVGRFSPDHIRLLNPPPEDSP